MSIFAAASALASWSTAADERADDPENDVEKQTLA